MKKCILDEKLKNLADTINLLLVRSDDSVGDIHILRKQIRELLSLIDITDPCYHKLKKIIKLTNTIRDIDVFFSIYLESLKPNYKKSLDMNLIIITTTQERDKLLKELSSYLINFQIPLHVKPADGTQICSYSIDELKQKLIFEQKKLHKYRIQIKHTLYFLKNTKKHKKKIIKTLTLLKDLLGKINDNFNGLTRLKKFQVADEKIINKIEKYTIKQNKKYFHKIEKINTSL